MGIFFKKSGHAGGFSGYVSGVMLDWVDIARGRFQSKKIPKMVKLPKMAKLLKMAKLPKMAELPKMAKSPKMAKLPKYQNYQNSKITKNG